MARRDILDPFGDGSLLDAFVFGTDDYSENSSVTRDCSFDSSSLTIHDGEAPNGFNSVWVSDKLSSSASSLLDGNVSFTITFWVYADSVGDVVKFSIDDYFEAENVYISVSDSDSDNVYKIYVDKNKEFDEIVFESGWHYVTLTYDSDSGDFEFFNDAGSQQVLNNPMDMDNTVPYYIDTQASDQRLADIQIFNRVLTNDEITKLKDDYFDITALCEVDAVFELKVINNIPINLDYECNVVSLDFFNDGSQFLTHIFKDIDGNDSYCDLTGLSLCFDDDYPLKDGLFNGKIYYNNTDDAFSIYESVDFYSNKTDFYSYNIFIKLTELNDDYDYVETAFESDVGFTTRLGFGLKLNSDKSGVYLYPVLTDDDNNDLLNHSDIEISINTDVENLYTVQFTYSINTYELFCNNVKIFSISDIDSSNLHLNVNDTNYYSYKFIANKIQPDTEIQLIRTFDRWLCEDDLTLMLKNQSYCSEPIVNNTVDSIELYVNINTPNVYICQFLDTSYYMSIKQQPISMLIDYSVKVECIDLHIDMFDSFSDRYSYPDSFFLELVLLTPFNIPIEVDSILIAIENPIKYEVIFIDSLFDITISTIYENVSTMPFIDGTFVKISIIANEIYIVCDLNKFIDNIYNLEIILNDTYVAVNENIVCVNESLFITIFANCGYDNCTQLFAKPSVIDFNIVVFEPYIYDIIVAVDSIKVSLNIDDIQEMLSAYFYISVITPNYTGGMTNTGSSIDYLSTVFAQVIDLKLTPMYLKQAKNVYIDTKTIQLYLDMFDVCLWEVSYPDSSYIEVKRNSNVAQPRVDKRVVKIGSVEFEQSLYWSQNEVVDTFVQKSSKTIDGNTVISVMPLRDFNRSYTISTDKDFSISKDKLDILISEINDESYDIIFTDGSFLTVKNDLLNKPLVATPIFYDYDSYYIDMKVLV